MQTEEPRPRYAHQLVYDEANRVHFMFGGNPGGKQGKEDKLRLGDFWRLQLLRPNRKEVLRRCRILIRQCKFSELASQDSMHALRYLHTSLSSIVDHHNSQEEREVKQKLSQIIHNLKNFIFAVSIIGIGTVSLSLCCPGKTEQEEPRRKSFTSHRRARPHL